MVWPQQIKLFYSLLHLTINLQFFSNFLDLFLCSFSLLTSSPFQIVCNSLKVTPSKKSTIWQIIKYSPWSELKWNLEPQASSFIAKFWTFWRHFYGQYEYRTMANCCRFLYTITLILFEGKTKTNCDTITSFSWPVLLSTDYSSRPISARESAQLL